MTLALKFLVGSLMLFVFAFVLVPIAAAVMASFLTNSQISGGVDLADLAQASVANFVSNLEQLMSEGELIASLIRTLVLAVVVGATTSICAMFGAYCMSRIRIPGGALVKALAYSAYLTPPVVLVIALAASRSMLGDYLPPKLLLGLGHVVFLFPLAFASALGHWSQGGHDLDRAAACDGAGFFGRFWIHYGFITPTLAFTLGLFMLTFMLSWSDVVFSRFLMLGNPDERLLTDLVLDTLASNELNSPRAQLASLSLLITFIATLAALGYGLLFSLSLKRN